MPQKQTPSTEQLIAQAREAISRSRRDSEFFRSLQRTFEQRRRAFETHDHIRPADRSSPIDRRHR